MAADRQALVRLVVDQVGRDVVQVDELRDGWPALCRVKVGAERVPVGLHLGRIGLSGRGRDDVERRFQNPADKRPVLALEGYPPALVGAYIDPATGRIAAMAGFRAALRIGRPTRMSLFLPLAGLQGAIASGWFDHVSASNEVIHIFRPELLPVHISLQDRGIALPEARAIVEASGFLEEEDEPAAERARQAAIRAARRRGFGQVVAEAYGERCAMCRLGSGLIEGAHIYPVEAPASPDKLWNGLALCRNHHKAFDLHRVVVDPGTRRILVHIDLAREAKNDDALAKFLDMTLEEITLPADPKAHPKEDMYRKRYAFYGEPCGWIGKASQRLAL